MTVQTYVQKSHLFSISLSRVKFFFLCLNISLLIDKIWNGMVINLESAYFNYCETWMFE